MGSNPGRLEGYAVIAHDTILLTGLHGDDYPARVVFDTEDYPEGEKPVRAELQIRDDDGQWHTVRALKPAQMEAYWTDLEKLRADAAADALIDQWSTACA